MDYFNTIRSIFEVTAITDDHTTLYKFGNIDANQPKLIEGRFEYTYTDSNNATHIVALLENTVGEAINAMAINENWEEYNLGLYWYSSMDNNLPTDPMWLVDQVMSLTIRENLPMRITFTSSTPNNQ